MSDALFEEMYELLGYLVQHKPGTSAFDTWWPTNAAAVYDLRARVDAARAPEVSPEVSASFTSAFKVDVGLREKDVTLPTIVAVMDKITALRRIRATQDSLFSELLSTLIQRHFGGATIELDVTPSRAWQFREPDSAEFVVGRPARYAPRCFGCAGAFDVGRTRVYRVGDTWWHSYNCVAAARRSF